MIKPKRKSKRTPKELELMFTGLQALIRSDNVPEPGSEEHATIEAMTSSTPESLSMYHLPVNVKLTASSTPIPLIILEEIIRRSPHRVICNVCNCREGKKCEKYPYNEYGCVHIGTSTAEHNDENVTHASVEETIAHVRKSVDAGLIPMVGHLEADLEIWDISEPFLTVCLCCSCCCLPFRVNKMMEKSNHKQLYHRLKGLQVVVDNDKCTGCEQCVPECFSGCITIKEDISRTDHELCTGCGVCVRTCPEGARTLKIENIRDAIDEFIGRLSPDVGGLPI
ncbi:MAG: 4Fe-4S binding protein, partial [Desulfobacterales bacterium]|nr:4Fe-4S binding protein [Desulfobacterales bacterium]